MSFAPHVSGHWFPAALSSDCRRKPHQVFHLGQPIALARDTRGAIVALEDRCPHRGAPLSAGLMSNDDLVCPYHGWSFDRSGRCTRMPGTKDAEPSGVVRARSWHAVEREGIVWVTRGEGRPLPSRLLALDPGRRRFLWQTTWQAPIMEAQDNFLDALHTHTVHPGLVRRAGQGREVVAHVAGSADGFHVDYRGQETQSGVLFRLFESRRTRERAHFSGLSIAQIEYAYASGWEAYITLCFAPIDLLTTRVFAMLHVVGKWAPSWLVRTLVWPWLRRVALQDSRMLALQTANARHFAEHRHIVSSLDVARPWLERAWLADTASETPRSEARLWI